ncbi:MAG TPA: fatty acid desaturase [Fimbriimonadaceae bacterium]|nr:fatty acid desaturase [Fimbriimonadaceae bacterium]
MATPARITEQRTVPNYRQQLRKELPAHYLQPDYVNLLWFLPHGLIIGGSLYVLGAAFNWWYAWLFSILIGHSMAGLGFLAHDIAHGGTIRNLRLRDLLAGIGFSAFGISPALWRRWHNGDHHTHTQVAGVDPDHLFTIEAYQHKPVLKALYRLSPTLRNIVIFAGFSFRMCQQSFAMWRVYLASNKIGPYEKLVMFVQPIIQMGAWVSLTYWIGGWAVVLMGYVVPLLIANFLVICYIATNHFLNPLADESDVLETSLSVTLPKWLRWLDPWHQFFGAHVAHHLFPQAPSRYTRKIEEKIAEMWPDRYHVMPWFEALRTLWNTPWIYDEDRVTFIDPTTHEKAPTLGHGLENRIKLRR